MGIRTRSPTLALPRVRTSFLSSLPVSSIQTISWGWNALTNSLNTPLFQSDRPACSLLIFFTDSLSLDGFAVYGRKAGVLACLLIESADRASTVSQRGTRKDGLPQSCPAPVLLRL